MGEASMHSLTILVDDHHEWKVDKILDNKIHYYKRCYLVKWKGFSIGESMWESEKNLENAQETLKNYLKKRYNYRKQEGMPQECLRCGYNSSKLAIDEQDSGVTDMFNIMINKTTTKDTVTEKDITDEEL
ncbi:uncharacterized protein CIMG_12588 [Coccidioides immitis RS]|uniref:Chromo domain-containing protein n=1 Tax=Coccidioides immitis (strain RS) TaxID=246410 RepID=A0A0D8JS19_COCIM|nr:uncharacterized protein CIMG_12588 [Coccidioides immitis RS]KJF59924.1 hypothetical protein CIMG_12588 [Coccidioides immitis RS]